MSSPDTRFQCRHILPCGHRCGSPALRQENFCYYHHSTRRPLAASDNLARRSHQTTFTLPAPDDRTSIQLAIAEIINRLAAHEIDPKRAALILYGLQIAACTLPKSIPSATQPETVEEIVETPEGILAPITEYDPAANGREKTLEQILLEQWAKDGEQAAEEARRLAEADGSIDLQACASKTLNPGLLNPKLEKPAFLNPLRTSKSTLNSRFLKTLRKNRRGGVPAHSGSPIRQLSTDRLATEGSCPFVVSLASKIGSNGQLHRPPNRHRALLRARPRRHRRQGRPQSLPHPARRP